MESETPQQRRATGRPTAQKTNGRRWWAAALLGTLAAVAGPAAAEVELVVGEGANPTVATNGSGEILVVWEDHDGSGSGIVGRRFDISGTALGDDFRVNQTLARAQREPAATYLANGNFVVVWQSHHKKKKPRVLAQCYRANGTALGDEFRINRKGAGVLPAIGADDHGNFAVAWSGGKKLGAGFKTRLRAFDRFGTALGDELAFGQQTEPRPPSVAVRGDGELLVVWSNPNDNIRGRLFNTFGTALGDGFRINASTAGDQARPRATVAADGAYTVTWERLADDGAERAVLVRRVGSGGTALGDDFQVSVTPFVSDAVPYAAADLAGNVAVTWRCDTGGGSGHADVLARLVDLAGVPHGDELHVHPGLGGDNLEAQAAVELGDDFVVVWERRSDDGSPPLILLERVEVP